MEVFVESATEWPMQVISKAAGCCYGKDNYSESRIISCLNAGHLSVFEHASATWSVKGISRACSHQLVRHRIASYSQQSQRYCKIDVEKDDWYVMPEWFEKDFSNQVNWKWVFEEAMAECAMAYQDAIENGCRPEDARYLLPGACKTEIFVTMNFREFMHFLDLRDTQQAQWEIRELAKEMKAALSAYEYEWHTLLDIYNRRCENALSVQHDLP